MLATVNITSSSTTLNELIEEFYDVFDINATQAPYADQTRIGLIAAAIRAANPQATGLPAADDTDFDDQDVAFLFLPPSAQSPWRVPSVESGSDNLRDDLHTIGIRSVPSLNRVTTRWIEAAFADEEPAITAWSTADIDRMKALCKLISIPGISANSAIAFHDHSTTPIRDADDLVGQTQLQLKALIEDDQQTVNHDLPQVVLDIKPFYYWRKFARAQSTTPRLLPPSITPVPVKVTDVQSEVDRWRRARADVGRSDEERASAEAVLLVREVQYDILSGNQALIKRDFQTAYSRLRKVWTRVGEYAKTLDAQLDDDEVSGPSFDTILGVSKALLLAMTDDDIIDTTAPLATERNPQLTGLNCFSIEELTSGAISDIETALANQPLSIVDRSTISIIERAMVEQTICSLPSSFKLGSSRSPDSWKLRQASPEERQHFRQALGGSTFTDLIGTGTLWSTSVRTQIPVFSLRSAPAVGYDYEAGTTYAKTYLSGTSLPDSLTEKLGVYDRYFAWTKNAGRTSTKQYIPLSSEFAAEYKTRILGSAMDVLERSDDNWMKSSDNWKQVETFAFLLPAIMATIVPLALARSMSGIGDHRSAESVRSGLVRRRNDASSDALPLIDSISSGTTYLEPRYTDCNRDTVLLETMREHNNLGDQAYMRRHTSKAWYHYTKVINLANHCDVLDGYSDALQTVRTHIKSEVESGNSVRNIRDLQLWKYVHEELDETITEVAPGLQVLTRGDHPRTAPSQVATGNAGATYFGAKRVAEEKFLTLEQIQPDPETPEFVTETTRPITEDIWDDSYLYQLDEPALLHIQILHAHTHLEQLKANLNWLGFDDETLPPWKFDFLLSQARYFAGKADELQNRTMSLIANGEGEQEKELLAAQGLEAAVQGIEVAAASRSIAESERTVATRQQTAAKQANKATKTASAFKFIGAGIAIAAASVATGGAAAVAITAAGALKAAGSGVGLVASFVEMGQASGQADAQLAIADAQLEVANDKVVLSMEQETLAIMRAAHATSYLTMLHDQELDSDAYFEIAEVIGQVSNSYLHMATRLAWLAQRAYQWETRRATRYVRDGYADPVAPFHRFYGAAELLRDLDALEHERTTTAAERPQLIKKTISLFKDRPMALMQLKETGETYVQLRLEELDYEYPGLFLHSISSVDIAFDGNLPSTGISAKLQVINSGTVRVPYSPDYVPNSSDVTMDWMYQGNHGTPESYSLDPEESGKSVPAFVRKPIYGAGATQIVSEFARARDGGLLVLPNGALGAFEHTTPDGIWVLKVVREGNTFDFDQISDVRLTMFMTAYHSEELARRQADYLKNPEDDETPKSFTLEGGRVVVASGENPAALTAFTDSPADATISDVRILPFDMAAEDFAAGQNNKVVQNISMVLLGATCPEVRLACRAVPFGTRVTPVQDPAGLGFCRAYSAVSPDTHPEPPVGGIPGIDTDFTVTALDEEGVPLEDPPTTIVAVPSLGGDFPSLDDMMSDIDERIAANYDNCVGRWTIKVLPDTTNGPWLRDDDGDEIVVETGEMQLTDGGWAKYTGGSWKHAQATCHVALVEGDFTLSVRDGATESVDAKISVGAASSGKRNLTVNLKEGSGTNVDLTSASYEVDETLDDIYRVTLVVADKTAQVLVDEVPITFTQSSEAVTTVALSASVEAGTAKVEFAEGVASPVTAKVKDIEVNRLRYTGECLETVVAERFEDDSAWTLSTTDATQASASHKLVDLSDVSDVFLTVNYTYEMGFVDNEPVSSS